MCVARRPSSLLIRPFTNPLLTSALSVSWPLPALWYQVKAELRAEWLAAAEQEREKEKERASERGSLERQVAEVTHPSLLIYPVLYITVSIPY